MKKLLTVFLLVALISVANAAVDIRIQKVSETLLAGTITLVVQVDIYPTWHWVINSLKGEFYIGDGLQALSPTPTVIDPDTFPAVYYNKTMGNQNGHFYFEFTEKPAFEGNPAVKQFSPSVWHEILRYSFSYPESPGQHTTFSWSSIYKAFGVDAWNAFLGAPYPVTGDAAQMPADLIDMSLPVQMNQFIAKYSYDRGVTLNWTTQSELNSAGFHIQRSENPNGPFEKVSASMIPGQGTCSSLHDYSFTDPNVKWDKTYYYQIHEISTQFMDTSRTFYGPLAVKTGKTPVGFHLSQNYPNPFNPGTEIEYVIDQPSHVTIKVYNILGKEMKTLVNEERPAEINKVKWDGTDAHGNMAPSGIYFYRILAGGNSEIRKMTKIQ
jgi:hypothetical protein